MKNRTLREEMSERFPNCVANHHKSRAAALKLMCLECVNGSLDEVRRCTVTTCPLYPWRPFKLKEPILEADTDGE
ncbi:MAG: hypothetical protein Q8P05_05410 [Candidatus Diapherotrites archaeon]|nr:hypothetical protein [Candidatus Diapherotrites archaeon]